MFFRRKRPGRSSTGAAAGRRWNFSPVPVGLPEKYDQCLEQEGGHVKNEDYRKGPGKEERHKDVEQASAEQEPAAKALNPYPCFITAEGIRGAYSQPFVGRYLGTNVDHEQEEYIHAYEDDFGRVFQADRIGQACLLNGQAKIGKQDDQEKFHVCGHLRTNPPVVFIPAEMNGQKDDQAENLPDEETQDSQANESQEGVHAVLVCKTGGNAVLIEMHGDAGGQP